MPYGCDGIMIYLWRLHDTVPGTNNAGVSQWPIDYGILRQINASFGFFCLNLSTNCNKRRNIRTLYRTVFWSKHVSKSIHLDVQFVGLLYCSTSNHRTYCNQKGTLRALIYCFQTTHGYTASSRVRVLQQSTFYGTIDRYGCSICDERERYDEYWEKNGAF